MYILCNLVVLRRTIYYGSTISGLAERHQNWNVGTRTPEFFGGTENDNFPLLYVMKMSLCRGVGGSKKPQNTLT